MINGHAVNYYTTPQAAEILGMTGSNVLLLLQKGTLKNVTQSNNQRSPKRIDVASVHALVDQRRDRRERLLAQKEAAVRRKEARAAKPVALPFVPAASDALMQQHIAQTQQVIDLLTKLVGVWCPAGTRQ